MPARMWRHGIHSFPGSLHQESVCFGFHIQRHDHVQRRVLRPRPRPPAPAGSLFPERVPGVGEHLFTTYLSIARGRFGEHHVLVLGPHPGIDGMGGLFWSILHNANVFFQHARFSTLTMLFLRLVNQWPGIRMAVAVDESLDGPNTRLRQVFLSHI